MSFREVKMSWGHPPADAWLHTLGSADPTPVQLRTVERVMRTCTDRAAIFWTPEAYGRRALKRVGARLPAHLECELWEHERPWLCVWPMDKPHLRPLPGTGDEVVGNAYLRLGSMSSNSQGSVG